MNIDWKKYLLQNGAEQNDQGLANRASRDGVARDEERGYYYDN